MALIESGRIELIDITDGRPAILNLAASLSKIQTETDGNYSPDYSQNNQVITPTLYIGQELIATTSYTISYTINGVAIENLSNVAAIEDNKLIIKANLEEENAFLIEANIAELNYNNNIYLNINAQLEIVKISSAANNKILIIQPSSSFFTNEINMITLTAKFFIGDTQISSSENLEVVWYKNGTEFTNAGENKLILNITKQQIESAATFTCQVKYIGSIYTSEIMIFDKTDPYSAQIISSKGLIFTSDIDETELTCSVYQNNIIITADNYLWYENAIEENNLKQESSSNIYTISPQNSGKQSITIFCVAKIGEKEVVSQITLLITSLVKLEITPQQIFLPFNSDGTYTENLTLEYSINAVLKNSAGIIINDTSQQSDITVTFSDSNIFEVAISQSENYHSYLITITCPEDSTIVPNSTIGTVSLNYRGVEIAQNFYLVKNIQGKDSATLQSIEVMYSPSNNGETPPDESEEWYSVITQISQEVLIKNLFIWTKTIYTYSDNSVQISYSVSKNSRTISKIQEYYTIGAYVIKTVVNNDEDASEISNHRTLKFATLYSPNLVEWFISVPFSTNETFLGQEVVEEKIEYNVTNNEEENSYVIVSEENISETSLWIKYSIIYEDGSFEETNPIPLQQINNLVASAAQAKTIYEDAAILSLVGTQYWANENGVLTKTTLASFLEQLPDEISAKLAEGTFYTYFNLKQQGVYIGTNESKFVTFTGNDGFHIQFYPNGYNPDAAGEDYKEIGTFDKKGLDTLELSLKNENFKNNSNLTSQIIAKGTSSGGWVWVKGSKRS